MAAAYAVSRTTVAESIVGVAAALVPPLSCVGITLARGYVLEAEGATILLVTNLAAIALGAALMFRRLGVPGTAQRQRSHLRVRRIGFTMILVLFLLTVEGGGRRRAGAHRPGARYRPDVHRALGQRADRSRAGAAGR
ncbi:MAG: DUF389 domain-containing protein [Planctomycetota bacterium]